METTRSSGLQCTVLKQQSCMHMLLRGAMYVLQQTAASQSEMK